MLARWGVVGLRDAGLEPWTSFGKVWRHCVGWASITYLSKDTCATPLQSVSFPAHRCIGPQTESSLLAVLLMKEKHTKCHYIATQKSSWCSDEGKQHSHCLSDSQAASAAYSSACSLFFAGSPVNMIPASSTVPVNTGRCPNPDLKVVYWGNGDPTLCAISCTRFL